MTTHTQSQMPSRYQMSRMLSRKWGVNLLSPLLIVNKAIIRRARECDKQLTAFVCMGRLLEFNQTPFGMCNAAQTFVRNLNILLRPLCHFTDSYIDDSAVFSDHWNLHLSHIDKFLSALENDGVTLNLSRRSQRL